MRTEKLRFNGFWRVWVAALQIRRLVVCVLTILFASTVAGQQNQDFVVFDPTAKNARKLADYIKASDWPDALGVVTSYVPIGPHQFLYEIQSAPIASGLFFVDTRTGVKREIQSGFVDRKTWLDAGIAGKTYYLLRSGGGSRGVGHSAYSLLEITREGEVDAWTLYAHSYDMKSGMCGRRSLDIGRGAEVLGYDLEPGRIVFSVVEQDCRSGKKRSIRISHAIEIRKPSFDCSKATKPAEHFVCKDAPLSRLDGLLAANYESVQTYVETPKQLRQDQLKWLALRDKCATSDCVSNSYYERLNELRKY